MSAITTKQCADEDAHRAHVWGHRMRCPGVAGEIATQETLYRLAKVYYEHVRLGTGTLPKPIAWNNLLTAEREVHMCAVKELLRVLNTTA